MEKRDSSELLLSLQREGILRGGKTARLTSPFTSPSVKVGTQVSDSAMPSIQAFPVSEGKGDGVDMMEQMRQLFSQQQDDMRRTIETTIAHHNSHSVLRLLKKEWKEFKQLLTFRIKFLNYVQPSIH